MVFVPDSPILSFLVGIESVSNTSSDIIIIGRSRCRMRRRPHWARTAQPRNPRCALCISGGTAPVAMLKKVSVVAPRRVAGKQRAMPEGGAGFACACLSALTVIWGIAPSFSHFTWLLYTWIVAANEVDSFVMTPVALLLTSVIFTYWNFRPSVSPLQLPVIIRC
jgi:hypothetical protein